MNKHLRFLPVVTMKTLVASSGENRKTLFSSCGCFILSYLWKLRRCVAIELFELFAESHPLFFAALFYGFLWLTKRYGQATTFQLHSILTILHTTSVELHRFVYFDRAWFMPTPASHFSQKGIFQKCICSASENVEKFLPDDVI